MTQERYDLIKPYLDQYKRRFTVLDLGAGIHTHISKDISNDYDCVAVVVEQDITDLSGYGPRTIVLKHHITDIELQKLMECEHFDVVLALNFLHHFPKEEWMMATLATLEMGTNVFVQVPDVGDATPGQEFLEALHSVIAASRPATLGRTVQFPQHPSRTLYHIEGRLKTLMRTHLLAHPGSASTLIADNFEGIQGRVRGKQWKDWIPGINLWNFIHLGGVLPDKGRILDMLIRFQLPTEHHGDVTPWNFILDGEQLHLVDGHEGWEFSDESGLAKTIRMVKEAL